MIGIQPDWHLVIGLGVTTLLGFLVGPLVRRVGASIGPLPSPHKDIETQWAKLYRQPTGGFWIGHLERFILFAAFWLPNAAVLMSSWLVFKLALYWQNANLIKFPDASPAEAEANYLVARRILGTYYIATLLVGTGASIVAALIGVATGHWIRF